jgi:hypothetical protein
MNRETIICDECESEYFSDSSQMKQVCTECSHLLYGYVNCDHKMIEGRCIKCFWNGNESDYIKGLRKNK